MNRRGQHHQQQRFKNNNQHQNFRHKKRFQAEGADEANGNEIAPTPVEKVLATFIFDADSLSFIIERYCTSHLEISAFIMIKIVILFQILHILSLLVPFVVFFFILVYFFIS